MYNRRELFTQGLDIIQCALLFFLKKHKLK